MFSLQDDFVIFPKDNVERFFFSKFIKFKVVLLSNKIGVGLSFIEIIFKSKDSSFIEQLILILLSEVISLILNEQFEFFISFFASSIDKFKLKILFSKSSIFPINVLLIIPNGSFLLLILFFLIKFPAFKVNVFLFL